MLPSRKEISQCAGQSLGGPIDSKANLTTLAVHNSHPFGKPIFTREVVLWDNRTSFGGD